MEVAEGALKTGRGAITIDKIRRGDPARGSVSLVNHWQRFEDVGGVYEGLINPIRKAFEGEKQKAILPGGELREKKNQGNRQRG